MNEYEPSTAKINTASSTLEYEKIEKNMKTGFIGDQYSNMMESNAFSGTCEKDKICVGNTNIDNDKIGNKIHSYQYKTATSNIVSDTSSNNNHNMDRKSYENMKYNGIKDLTSNIDTVNRFQRKDERAIDLHPDSYNSVAST